MITGTVNAHQQTTNYNDFDCLSTCNMLWTYNTLYKNCTQILNKLYLGSLNILISVASCLPAFIAATSSAEQKSTNQ